MNDTFGQIVTSDPNYLGAAPEIDATTRLCSFPGCQMLPGAHIRFGAGEDAIEVVDIREYHRGDVGYYLDELQALAAISVEYFTALTRRPDHVESVLIADMSAGLATRVYAAGYRRIS